MNRKHVICFGTALAFISFTRAATPQCPLPILATQTEGLIYVSRVGITDRTLPKRIAVLGIPFWEEVNAPIPKVYIAEFLKEMKAVTKKEGEPTTEEEQFSALVYKLVDSPATFHYGNAIIFNVDQEIQYERKDGEPFYKDIGANLSWFVLQRVSREGFHNLLQSFDGEKCISTIDYYEYAEYGTGEEEDVQKLEKTYCGQKLLPEDVHPKWE